jgi:hypothetical protein
MTLEEEIVELTDRWYRYVGMDHHKDRDCHWYITKTYSYGQEPYWVASHHGYRSETWYSPKCGTEELAETILRDKLKALVQEALEHLREDINNEEALDWMGISKEILEEMIKGLE